MSKPARVWDDKKKLFIHPPPDYPEEYPEVWSKDISSAPSACHVLAAYLDEEGGEWVMQYVPSPPEPPYTHWKWINPPKWNG